MLRTLTTLLVSLLVSVVSGCQAPPQFLQPSEPFPYTEFVADGPLAQVQPADILVPPVHDQSPRGSAPVERIRGALMESLVERLYSPLSPTFADARGVEAGFDPTDTGADAVLQVVVTRWDTTLLGSHGAVEAAVEARLLDGRHPARPLLWGVSIGRRLDASASLRGQLSDQELLVRAAGELAGEILDLLPERDPNLGPGR